MKKDACNVEDKNILHIEECLLLYCVASFEDWSNILRTRSFTLCKNDLDFHDRSDSVTVLESIVSSSTVNLSVCSVNKPGGPFLLPSLHQISTLEKTIFRQHSTLSNLMTKRL